MNLMSKSILYVDLDGTLLRGDTLHEAMPSVFARPVLWPAVVRALFQGKAAFKKQVAVRSRLDVGSLPYRKEFVTWLAEQRAAGRSLVLATGADRAVAEAVAGQLGLFDGVLASDGTTNLTGIRKLEAIKAHAAGRPFAYAGNDSVDAPIFEEASSAVLVGRAVSLEHGLKHVRIEARFDSEDNRLGAVMRLLRPHQWAKNILVFLPAAAAHRFFDPTVMTPAAGLFVAFSLCASGVYALNDLLDLAHDRVHPHKQGRPLASGAVSIPLGLATAMILPLAAFAVAFFAAGPGAVMMLAGYWAATTYYSMHGKRVPLLDVFLLAGLYTFRAFAGALTVPTGISVWMTAFLLFLFLSLACLKRFSELIALPQEHADCIRGRGYRREDHVLMGALGVGSAFAATLVLCLYVAGPGVVALYARPAYLMGMAPAVLFGLARFWLQASRGELHADPVVHAMRDVVSYLLLATCLACMALASIP